MGCPLFLSITRTAKRTVKYYKATWPTRSQSQQWSDPNQRLLGHHRRSEGSSWGSALVHTSPDAVLVPSEGQVAQWCGQRGPWHTLASNRFIWEKHWGLRWKMVWVYQIWGLSTSIKGILIINEVHTRLTWRSWRVKPNSDPPSTRKHQRLRSSGVKLLVLGG